MEKNTFRVNQDFFNIMDCVKSAFEVVRHVASKKKIQLVAPSVSFCDHKFYKAVNGDRDRIMQVIINFLSNSIKFSNPNSQIKVDLSLIEVHTPNMHELFNQHSSSAEQAIRSHPSQSMSSKTDSSKSSR